MDLIAYDMRDIRSAFDTLGDTPRREGETSFPDWPTMKAAILRAERIRENTIQPGELSPEVEKALADSARDRKMIASGRREGMASFDVTAAVRQLSANASMDSPRRAKTPTTCQHCELASSSTDPAMLRRIAAHYSQAADRAEERNQVKTS